MAATTKATAPGAGKALHAPQHKAEKKVPMHKSLIFSGISGAIATTCIYPIDITKTKLMDQKAVGAAQLYKGPIDCAKKIIQAEGFKGMYRGWPPNVLLVMPEKAIKLSFNDFFRSRLARPDGTLSDGAMMLAGGLAGLCQVTMTNPMELLKIQGATMRDKFKAGEIKEVVSYPQLVRNLGWSGLYTGVAATLARDIPFSMVYFWLYSRTNDAFVGKGDARDRAGFPAFAAGAVAGTVAAAITTPLDVVKTRVHSNARAAMLDEKGLAALGAFLKRETSLIAENVSRIQAKEGPTAFFKGIVPRCLIISPLFAITMTCFEQFKKRFG